jgi:hypothetical protein
VEKQKIELTPADLKEELDALKNKLLMEGNTFEKLLKTLNKTEDEFAQAYKPMAALRRATAAKVDTQEIRAAFEKGKEKLPLRRVSQILISYDKAKFSSHPERPKEDAQKLAESVLERARRGEDFAALARDLSDDGRTREKGGDLDFIRPVDMPKAFGDAAYALQKVGDISELVETELGFHVIKLTEMRSEEDAFQQYTQMSINQRATEAAGRLAKEAKVE